MEMPSPEFGQELPQNVEKIAEGHEQVQAARLIDAEFLAGAYEQARWNLQRLDQDQEVLERYGHAMPQNFVRILQNSSQIVKALQMATEVVGALTQNDPVLTPQQRAGLKGGGSAG